MVGSNLEPSPETRKGSLSALLASAVDGIVVIHENGEIQTVSTSAARLFGYDMAEFIGRNVNFLMPEEHRRHHDGYMRAYRTTGVSNVIGKGREVNGRRKDGSIFPMHLSVGKFEEDGQTFFTGIIHDLTRRNDAEHALREVQKIEALGQLTGGVAHDFNNLLAVIMGNLDLLMMTCELGPGITLAEEALKAAELGASLTERLLAFARRSALQPHVVQLNDLIVSLLPLLQRTLGETIALTTELDPDAWRVTVDPAQFQTALVNLSINARDAMPQGGKLVIETRNFPLDKHFIGEDLGLKLGQYVTVGVTDTGCGMTQAVKDRVFEPFFTTKPLGKGTGLGLSMVYGFTKQSGGEVTIYSEIGKGTTVNLHLPRQEDALQAPDTPADVPSGVTSATGETILLVEDNDQVRRLTRKRLEMLGFVVLEAMNGPDAVTLLQANPQIDLVFTDLVMPGGMSGYDVARYVQDHHPKVHVLLTSGYAEELMNADKLQDSCLNLLRKPYSQASLSEALKDILETAA